MTLMNFLNYWYMRPPCSSFSSFFMVLYVFLDLLYVLYFRFIDALYKDNLTLDFNYVIIFLFLN